MIRKIQEKKKRQIVPKRLNQRAYNRIFVFGLFCYVFLTMTTIFLSVRAIVKNSNRNEPVLITSESVDYRAQNYLNNFVYYYFTIPEDYQMQNEHLERLSKFYVSGLEMSPQSIVRQPTKLESYKLMSINDSLATYLVKYTVSIETDRETGVRESQQIVTEFVVPYAEKEGKFYVSDFPYFLPIQANQVERWSKNESITLEADNLLEDEKQSKLREFVNLFFTNYVSSQENLDLISKNITVLPSTQFSGLVWGNVEEKNERLIVRVQVTFVTAGNSRNEHFTLEISNKKGYFVEKMIHGLGKE